MAIDKSVVLDNSLIDTSALIWYALEPARLSQRAALRIREKGNIYSHVSLWEMAIKSSLGKLKLASANGQTVSARIFMQRLAHELDLYALPLELDNFADLEGLPFHHRDPFDRMLVVQAKRANLPIVSADAVFEKYGVERIW